MEAGRVEQIADSALPDGFPEKDPSIISEKTEGFPKFYRKCFIENLARDLYLEQCKQRQGKVPPATHAVDCVKGATELSDALELED